MNSYQRKKYVNRIGASKKETKVSNAHNNQRIKHLKYIKNVVQNLPTSDKYHIDEETNYLRLISSIVPLMKEVRHEELPYIISAESYKKITTQFIRQTQDKEIIVVLLIEISKGFGQYVLIIQKMLHDVLQFMIQFDRIKINPSQSMQERNKNAKSVMQICIFNLIDSIRRWYAHHPQILQKYQRLQDSMIIV